MSFKRLPESRAISGEFGKFEMKVETAGDVARVETTLELGRSRIEASEYRQFREFLRQVDASLEQAFEAEREGRGR